jgi:hypothetical protein
MPNPRKKAIERCRPTGISLPANILKAAQRIAYARGVSLSWMVRELLVVAIAAEAADK